MAVQPSPLEGVVNKVAEPMSLFAPTKSFWRGKRIFLTGHTGFKGSWLTLWLAHLGAEVRGYALAPDTNPAMFEALEVDSFCDSRIGDIRDASSLATAIGEFRPQIAIHMAAQPLVRRSYREPLQTFETNVQGTANFLEACRGIDTLRAVVVVTTDKCYENHGELRPYREDDPLGGHDPYSASKACAELVVQAYRRSFFGGSKSALLASARAGNVIGGGDWSEDRLIPDAVRAFSTGQTVGVRNPDAVRPWQHVVAPSSGYLMLVRALFEQGKPFATAFNFGPRSDRALPVRAVVEQAAATWGDGAAWESHADTHAVNEAQLLMLDPSRARQMLGWRPADDMAAAITATVAWYKAFYSRADAKTMRQLTSQQIAALGPALQRV